MMQAGTKFVYHTRDMAEPLPLARRVLYPHVTNYRRGVQRLPLVGASHEPVVSGLLTATP